MLSRTLIVFSVIGTVRCIYDYKVKYVATGKGELERECGFVCSEAGFECYDDVYSEMECAHAASYLCGGDSAVERRNNELQCAYGGCFVSCPSQYAASGSNAKIVYSDREVEQAQCNVAPSCQPANQYMYQQVCACYEPITYTFKMGMMEIVGLCFSIIFFVGLFCLCGLYYYFIKRNDDFIDETSFTDFVVSVLTCKSCWEFCLGDKDGDKSVENSRNAFFNDVSKRIGSFFGRNDEGHIELSTTEHDGADVSSHSSPNTESSGVRKTSKIVRKVQRNAK